MSVAPATMPAVVPARSKSFGWRQWRDRLLQSERFRRWAAAFPLTRGIARRRARAVFDLTAGFVYSQVLTACVRLHLFDLLADGPLSVARIAARLDLTEAATLRLLRAAASLRLVEARGAHGYGLGDLGATLVGNAALEAMVLHHARLYADLRDPVALLRGEAGGGALSELWAYARAPAPETIAADRVAEYSTLMATSQSLIADEVLAAYPFSGHRRVLDVGGGEGAFLEQVAAATPQLQLELLDLPAVATRAEIRLARAGLASRSVVHGGDFLRMPLPKGADLITLIRVVHDHDDPAVATLLTAARAALPSGGTVLIAEPMAGAPGAEVVGDAYFGFYLLAMGQGRARSARELTDLLHGAGFVEVRTIPTRMPLQTGVVVGRVP